MISTLKNSALAIPFAIVFLLAAPGDAQEKDALKNEKRFAPTGIWNWERKTGDQTVKCKLTVSRKKDGSFAGKYEDKDHKLAIKNAKLKEGNFSFEVSPHPEEPQKVIQFNGKVSADSIKGNRSYTFNDKKVSTEWMAKRFDPLKPMLGKWELEFETPDGTELQFVIRVKKKGDGLSVSFVDDDTAKIDKVRFNKNVLSFETEQEYQDQPLDVEWELKLNGDQLDGKLYFEFQNSPEKGEIEVSGDRLK